MDYDKANEIFQDIRLGIAEYSELLEYIYTEEKKAYEEGYRDAKEFYEKLITNKG